MSRVAVADSNGLANVRGDAYKNSGTKKHELYRFNSTAGLTLTGGATAAAVTYNGQTWVKVTGVANTNFEIQIPAFSLAAPIGPHIVWVYALEDWTKIANVLQYVGSAAFGGNLFCTNTISAGGVFGRNGIQMLENNPYYTNAGGSGWTRSAGTTAAAKIRVTPQTGEVGVIYLHSVFFMANPIANIVIGFDDNMRSITETTASSVTLRGVSGSYTFQNIVDAYGYKGTLWLVTGYIDGSVPPTSGGTLTWAEINALVADGWDAQVQTHADPGNSSGLASAGSVLLGPQGYAAKAISSVANAANQFTSSATHYIYTSAYGYPIIFSGTDLPSPVVAGTTYWAKGTGATTFTIYPTRADSIASTNIIDLTTDGIAANFTYRYAGSANDHTAIQADFQACIDAITTNVGVVPRFVAYNQGSVDEYVELAARNCGMKVSRTTFGNTLFGSSYLFDTDLESQMYPHQQNYTVNVGEAADRSAAYYIALIATAIKAGLCIHTYCHGSSTQVNQNLANFCDAALYYERAGLATVKTMSEYYDARLGTRPSVSRLSA